MTWNGESTSFGLYEATSTATSSITTATVTDHGAWARSPALSGESTPFSAYSNGTWTFSFPGTYLVTFSNSWAPNATGRRIAILAKNGTEVRRMSTSAVASENMTVEVVHIVTVAAGDTVTTQVYQSSGGSLALAGGSIASTFQAVRVV